MGVWSSIGFCNVDKRRISHTYSPRSGNSNVKQVLNIDSDLFSTTVLQDVKEIRIQESYFENSDQLPSNNQREKTFGCPSYFEYSMGGNLKFYKEHLQQDFELENKLYPVKKLGQRLRKTSHSDNDSEPESLRYARKPQEKAIHVVNTIAEEQEAELSFDDYSTIYQPEFMLNINSQSLVKEMPQHVLEEKVIEEERRKEGERKKEDGSRMDKNKTARCSQDLIENSSPEKIENEEVHVVNKSEILSAVKQNSELTNQEDMFDYHSSSAKAMKKIKHLDKHEIKSIEHKNKECQKRKTISMKPRKSKSNQGSGNNLSAAKNTLPKEKSPSPKHKKDIFSYTAAPLKEAESKIESKNRAKKSEKKENSKKLKLIQTTEFDYENHTPKSFNNKNILPSAENNPRNNKTQDNFLSRLSMDTIAMFDDIDLFEELRIAETENKLSEPTKKDAEFYPESPIAELHFFKTPCSTRHNSLETFEQLENECIEDNIKQEPEESQDNTQTSKLLPEESYKKLPKEFQEMARRLSKKDSPKKSSASLHQVSPSLQNLNCSSSTCSIISPRSPSGRKLFRTPSYKMPKTPSLSRQHPSTYVTQHTSSRSRPSSRVSSRATSPTREHIEALL